MAYFQSCFPADDEFDGVAHKSDEEEDDVLSAVAAMKQRDADVQSQLPQAAGAEPEEEAVGPSWSDLEASAAHLLFLSSSLHLEVVKSVVQGNVQTSIHATEAWVFGMECSSMQQMRRSLSMRVLLSLHDNAGISVSKVFKIMGIYIG